MSSGNEPVSVYQSIVYRDPLMWRELQEHSRRVWEYLKDEEAKPGRRHATARPVKRPTAATCTICERPADRFAGKSTLCLEHYQQRNQLENAGTANPIRHLRERLAARRAAELGAD